MKKEGKPKKRTATHSRDVEKILIENFVSLQKVMTNVTVKFSELSTRIDNLLKLFEVSAKAIAQGDYDKSEETETTKEILQEIQKLSEQNKIIAKGVTLLHQEKPQQQKIMERAPTVPKQSFPPKAPPLQEKKPSAPQETHMKGFEMARYNT